MQLSAVTKMATLWLLRLSSMAGESMSVCTCTFQPIAANYACAVRTHDQGHHIIKNAISHMGGKILGRSPYKETNTNAILPHESRFFHNCLRKNGQTMGILFRIYMFIMTNVLISCTAATPHQLHSRIGSPNRLRVSTTTAINMPQRKPRWAKAIYETTQDQLWVFPLQQTKKKKGKKQVSLTLSLANVTVTYFVKYF